MLYKDYFLLTLRQVPGTHAVTINEGMPIRGTLWQIITMIAIIIPHIFEPVISQKRLEHAAKLNHIPHNNKTMITGKRRGPNARYSRNAGNHNSRNIPIVFHIKFFLRIGPSIFQILSLSSKSGMRFFSMLFLLYLLIQSNNTK